MRRRTVRRTVLVRLEESLLERAREVAAVRGITLSLYLEQLLRDEVEMSRGARPVVPFEEGR